MFPVRFFGFSCELSPLLGECVIVKEKAKNRVDKVSIDVEKIVKDIKNKNFVESEISFLGKKIKTELPRSLFVVKKEILINLEYCVAGYIVKNEINIDNTKLVRKIIFGRTKKYHRKVESLCEEIKKICSI